MAFVFSYSYALPFGAGNVFAAKGFVGKLAQGWVITGLGMAQSGAPFTVILPTDNANIGAGPAQRPNVAFDPNTNAPHTKDQWFNTAAFQMPAPFTFGNAGRNVVFGDDEVDTDFALHKNTAINERLQVEFRAEIFNLMNHTNFADVPGRTAFTSTFGRYASAENPRQTQFALKLLF